MSLFKRLLNPKSGKSKTTEDTSLDKQHSKYYPEKQLPIDEKFTYNFRRNGGKFLYCENLEELMQTFDNILMENDWYEAEAFCIDQQLIERFDGFNLKFGTKSSSKFFLSRCESLIANNGSVLISSNQIREKKLGELPTNFIIFSTTSQLVENIGEGLRQIKDRNKNKIPTNITTIQDFETQKEKDFMSYGSTTKNLYLLLLEDL
ncbi:LUD domain-containing protein [Gilvibacter sp. SZ-19]|uniref:LUD domain-containing protein n=1 Tax=unclassified Gilvibacter TaxID=2625242 RepID=UPI000B3CF624|nr:LUD domain-containing protein [Gilvibacter sp. SZ-19]ARV11289.1 lactate utilization protein B/C [Gilvibacter sp. SZ-19]